MTTQTPTHDEFLKNAFVIHHNHGLTAKPNVPNKNQVYPYIFACFENNENIFFLSLSEEKHIKLGFQNGYAVPIDNDSNEIKNLVDFWNHSKTNQKHWSYTYTSPEENLAANSHIYYWKFIC